jgi:hypothetical protein
MERSHGWHQRDGSFSCPKALERAMQHRNRAGDNGASRLQGASRHGGSVGWVSRQRALLRGGSANPIKAAVVSPAEADDSARRRRRDIRLLFLEAVACMLSLARFMIKEDNQSFDAIAHFT